MSGTATPANDAAVGGDMKFCDHRCSQHSQEGPRKAVDSPQPGILRVFLGANRVTERASERHRANRMP